MVGSLNPGRNSCQGLALHWVSGSPLHITPKPHGGSVQHNGHNSAPRGQAAPGGHRGRGFLGPQAAAPPTRRWSAAAGRARRQGPATGQRGRGHGGAVPPGGRGLAPRGRRRAQRGGGLATAVRAAVLAGDGGAVGLRRPAEEGAEGLLRHGGAGRAAGGQMGPCRAGTTVATGGPGTPPFALLTRSPPAPYATPMHRGNPCRAASPAAPTPAVQMPHPCLKGVQTRGARIPPQPTTPPQPSSVHHPHQPSTTPTTTLNTSQPSPALDTAALLNHHLLLPPSASAPSRPQPYTSVTHTNLAGSSRTEG